MELNKIKSNPDNPRIKRDDKFALLCKSIKEFPKMMELRPMILDENSIVLGGNMRLEALKFLGYKVIPETWYKRTTDLTESEKREFIVKDNVSFGDWDWDLLTEWESEGAALLDWGIEEYQDSPDPNASHSIDDIEKMTSGIEDGVPEPLGSKKVNECTCPKCGFKWAI